VNDSPDDPLDSVIASVIAQVRPEAMETVVAAIARRPGLEVHGQDPRGRLVVVLELANDAALAEEMNMIGNLPGVLGVNLVYHYAAAIGETPAAALTETGDA
jgi:nitrate reductase NapD